MVKMGKMEKIRKIYTCFPGGRYKVLTMSYDDGREEDRRLVKIFNENGIRGTFNLNTGRGDDVRRIPQAEWKDLYKGHEIACHTFSHPTISRCPLEGVTHEVMVDRTNLEAITGTPVRGMAYPNGSTSEDIRKLLPFLGIRYARVTQTTGGFAIPEDFFSWAGTCHHRDNLIERGKEFLDFFKKQYLYLMYVWGHSYEFTNDDNWEVMEEFCAMMGGKDDIWYATNIEIVDYLDAAKRLEFTAALDKVYNPSAIDVWVEVDDEKHYRIPSGELVTF